jgi:hypothetical protein
MDDIHAAHAGPSKSFLRFPFLLRLDCFILRMQAGNRRLRGLDLKTVSRESLAIHRFQSNARIVQEGAGCESRQTEACPTKEPPWRLQAKFYLLKKWCSEGETSGP